MTPTPELEAAVERLTKWLEMLEGMPGIHPQRIADARLVLASLPTGTGEGEWLPVETAPHACHVHACRFDSDAGEWVYAIVLSPPTRPFTHWRPLPPPPHQPGA